MPGSIASYSSCMTPSSPMRGLSALAIDVLVAVVEGIDGLLLERLDGPERARQVDDPRGLLAHDGGLERLARAAAQREHAVGAHEHGGRAVAGKRLDDATADLLVADQGERPDRDLAAELVCDRGHRARDRLAAHRPGRRVGAV